MLINVHYINATLLILIHVVEVVYYEIFYCLYLQFISMINTFTNAD